MPQKHQHHLAVPSSPDHPQQHPPAFISLATCGAGRHSFSMS